MNEIDTQIWDKIALETLIARHSLSITPFSCDSVRQWEVFSLDSEIADKHCAPDLRSACYLAIAASLIGINPSACCVMTMYEGTFSDNVDHWEWEVELESGTHSGTTSSQAEAIHACIGYMLAQAKQTPSG